MNFNDHLVVRFQLEKVFHKVVLFFSWDAFGSEGCSSVLSGCSRSLKIPNSPPLLLGQLRPSVWRSGEFYFVNFWIFARARLLNPHLGPWHATRASANMLTGWAIAHPVRRPVPNIICNSKSTAVSHCNTWNLEHLTLVILPIAQCPSSENSLAEALHATSSGHPRSSIFKSTWGHTS